MNDITEKILQYLGEGHEFAAWEYRAAKIIEKMVKEIKYYDRQANSVTSDKFILLLKHLSEYLKQKSIEIQNIIPK